MENLKGIEWFPAITYLKLSRNNLDSLQELKRLSLLRNLKGISLYKNPLADDKQSYTIGVLSSCPVLESLDHNSCIELRKQLERDGLLEESQETDQLDDRSKGDSLSAVISNSAGFHPHAGSGNVGEGKNSHNSNAQPSISGDAAAFKNQKLAMVKGLSKQMTRSPIQPMNLSQKSQIAQENKTDIRETEYKLDDGDEEEDLEDDGRNKEIAEDDIFALNPKVVSTVKLAFDKKLKERNCILGYTAKKDEEIWLGSPTHPIGFFKRVSNNNYKVVGDGLWMLMASKTVTIKLIEEVSFIEIDIL